MFFVNDIVLIDETEIGANVKLNLWRDMLESKGLRLSRSNRNYIQCNFSGNGVQMREG